MTSPDRQQGLAALAEQIAELRGQVLVLATRMKKAGITGEVDLAGRFEDLAATVARALDESAPQRIPAPRWTDIDEGTRDRQLAELSEWAENVLRAQYAGYELASCWRNHPHVVWEMSTLAAEWHRIYTPARPDLSRALDFYDRWLPNCMRRINEFTRKCALECAISRSR